MPRSARFVLGFLAAGCSALGAPPAPGSTQIELYPTRDGAPARVLRIQVRTPATQPLERGALWLFAGELSDYYVTRVERGELPSTLSERLVGAEVWANRDGGFTLAPNRALDPGATYTLAALGRGKLTTFTVSSDDPAPLLARVWPPPGVSGAGAFALCGDDAPNAAQSLTLEPGGVSARLAPGFGWLADGRRCVEARLASEPDSEVSLVLPAESGGFLLDPAPLRAAAQASVAPIACFPGELSFGPACAEVGDDRLELFPMPEPVLWRLPRGEEFSLLPVPANQRFTVHGFAPDSEQRLAGFALSQSGGTTAFEVSFRTEPLRAHVVLSEVLANPLGPEPAAEWVELVNDSARAIELDGFVLGDGGGSVTLPAASLDAHAYALLVRADYDETAPADVPIAPGTALVRLPSLGTNGLSNAGEALWLRDPAGTLLSEFPAVAAARPGVSIARARPDAAVDEPGAFGPHSAPGASPGSANGLASAVSP